MSRKAAKPIALVLCGGAGTRMAPWSDARHKCLVSVDQECRPLFARHVDRLRAHGFRVHANVGADWSDAFRDVARGMHAPVTVIPEGGKPHGSGTTLLRLARADVLPRAYAVVCGDVWYSDWWYTELREMADFVARQDYTSVGMFATEHDPTELGGPGLVELKSGYVQKYAAVRRVEEAPCRRWPDGAVQATGMTVWSRSALEIVAGHFGKRVGVDMMRDMLPRALRVRAPACVSVFARVCARNGIADVGTPLRYARHVARQYEDHGRTQLGEDAASGIVALLTARRILTAGNGGACAVAQHAAIDWQKAGGRDVMALADHVVGSAWANDHGYDSALACQVERVVDPSDAALVVFSASGTSANVVNVVRRARELGYHAVVAVSRADSTAWVYKHATHRVKLPFGLPRSVREYGAIEDAMQAWVHAAAAMMSGLAPWRSEMAEGGA